MMIESPLVALAAILSSAAAAQWVGGRIKLPSVIFLLGAGLALSPVLDPDRVFGDLLFTGVGLGVAVLLFEGGASLSWHRIGAARAPVVRLVTLGALVSWLIASVAVKAFLGLDTRLSLLIGAILIVSGPTVITPILRAVRPREPTASILRWEGILIDPIGAGLAIVVLDSILENRDLGRAALQVVTTFGAGLAVGTVIGAALIGALALRQIPDYLQVNLTLAGVVAAYAVANELRPEAGLVAVTLMGMAFANQRRAPSAHIVEFSEHLGGLILGALFIVLGARVEIGAVLEYLPASIAIIAVLALVARPAAVLAATLGSGLTTPHQRFLILMAPRGVVAAAVASLFADELEHYGHDPGPLVPVVFTVVLASVLIVGLSAKPVARRLRIAQAEPNGLALIGGGRFAIALAERLADHQIPVIHVGVDDDEEKLAAEAGQMVYSGRIDRHEFVDTMSSLGIRQAVALSGIDHLDTFALRQLVEVVGSENLYGMFDPSPHDDVGTARLVRPRHFLPGDFSAGDLHAAFENGAVLRAVGPDAPETSRIEGSSDDEIWLTVARIDPNAHQVSLGRGRAVSPSQVVIELGPMPRHEKAADGDPAAGGDERSATQPESAG